MKLEILTRHLVAAVAGMLTHAGFAVENPNAPACLFAAFLCFIGSWLWSAIAKTEMSDENKDVVKKTCAAFASQAVAALAGWLQAGDATAADTTALLLFTGNAALSHLRGHVPPAKLAQWMGLVLGSSFVVLGSACSNVSRDAFYARLEASSKELLHATSIVALEASLTTLRNEIELLEQRPVDADPAQQLIDQTRHQSLRAVLAEGEARLRELKGKGQNAKQPVSVQPAMRPVSVLSAV